MLFFTFCFLVSLVNAKNVKTQKNERILHMELFEKYDAKIRPVKHPNQSVLVEFEVHVAQLSQINEVITNIFYHLGLRFFIIGRSDHGD